MTKAAVAPAKRVLIVDDEPLIRELLRVPLSNAGYEVEQAGDGVEGLESLKAKSFDLVLLDIWMPRMNGIEMLAGLHSLPSPPRVIVMTADHTPDTLLNAIREEAYHYIGKPFSPSALVELVGKTLSTTAPAPPIEILSAKSDWVELLVPCEPNVVERIQSFLIGMKGDLPEALRETIGQAFRELLLNAIEWGGKLDPNRKVHIAYLRTKRMIMYRIADPGSGFRFDQLPHSALSNPAGDSLQHLAVREEKGLRPGGFGILLTRALVDELIYNQAQNEVVFIKYLS